MRSLFAWCLATLLLAVDHGLSISGEIPWSHHLEPTPVVLTITSDRPRNLRLDLRGDTNSANAVVPIREGTTRKTLVMPPDPGSKTWVVRLTWNDGTFSDSLGISFNNRNAHVVTVDDADSTALSTAVTSSGHRRNGYFKLTRDQLPDLWQGYLNDQIVILGPESQRDLTPAQHQALATWLTFGGRMMLLSADQRAGWPAGADVRISPRDDLPTTVPEWNNQIDAENHHLPDLTPIPGTERPATGLLVSLVVLFALIAGPLVIWWCWRHGQRTRLFIITPVLSAGFVVLLVVINLVSEGTAIRRQASQLLVLDQARHQAALWTGCTWFAPFGLGRVGMDPTHRAVLLVGGNPDPWNMQQDGRSVSGLTYTWGPELELDGPWVAPRTNRRLLMSGFISERGRLTIKRQDQGYVLHNGLGSTITWATWESPGGHTLVVRDLAPGTSKTLAAEAAPTEEPANDLGPQARKVWTIHTRPGDFRARLAQPLHPLPGPPAEEPTPPAVWLTTTLREDAP